MVKLSVSLEGSLDKWIAEQKQKVQQGTKSAIVEHADKVLASAQELCPTQTGKLKESLYVKVSESGLTATVRTDAKQAPYGHLVSFGSIHNEADPFLYKASDRHKPELAPLIAEKIEEQK